MRTRRRLRGVQIHGVCRSMWEPKELTLLGIKNACLVFCGCAANTGQWERDIRPKELSAQDNALNEIRRWPNWAIMSHPECAYLPCQARAQDARTEDGSAPLWHAVSGGSPDAVRVLLATGADPSEAQLIILNHQHANLTRPT
eukprot:1500638-Amphidinium_carterae.1